MVRIGLIIIVVVALISGCMTGKSGQIPDTEALQSQLTPDVSSKADVLRVLGPPRGYGMALLPNLPGSGGIWFYEYVESHLNKSVDFKMLLVFFAGETYVGYLWFSSVGKMETQ